MDARHGIQARLSNARGEQSSSESRAGHSHLARRRTPNFSRAVSAGAALQRGLADSFPVQRQLLDFTLHVQRQLLDFRLLFLFHGIPLSTLMQEYDAIVMAGARTARGDRVACQAVRITPCSLRIISSYWDPSHPWREQIRSVARISASWRDTEAFCQWGHGEYGQTALAPEPDGRWRDRADDGPCPSPVPSWTG